MRSIYAGCSLHPPTGARKLSVPSSALVFEPSDVLGELLTARLRVMLPSASARSKPVPPLRHAVQWYREPSTPAYFDPQS